MTHRHRVMGRLAVSLFAMLIKTVKPWLRSHSRSSWKNQEDAAHVFNHLYNSMHHSDLKITPIPHGPGGVNSSLET